MAMAVLVLQYPDRTANRTIALASTKDGEALRVFKRAALADARGQAARWEYDEALRAYGLAELERLEALFEDIVPEPEDNSGVH